jgi:hypothetical protein
MTSKSKDCADCDGGGTLQGNPSFLGNVLIPKSGGKMLEFQLLVDVPMSMF